MTSRKNERVCEVCRHPFWAWSTGRTVCYQCQPLPRYEAERLKERIDRGEVRL
jgi:uncharacterized Zn finger protein (UPF0148 family)